MTNKAAFLAVWLLACQAKPIPSGSATSPPASAEHLAQSNEGPQRNLDRLDSRTPLPLLPMMANHQKANMRAHLAAVQQIVAAAADDDFPAIERAGSQLGFSTQMGQMCEHMGAGAPGFTELALKFHHDADRIATAARKRDRPQVLRLLGDTLSQCTGCHEKFKQAIVDEREWSAATGAVATPPPTH